MQCYLLIGGKAPERRGRSWSQGRLLRGAGLGRMAEALVRGEGVLDGWGSGGGGGMGDARGRRRKGEGGGLGGL